MDIKAKKLTYPGIATAISASKGPVHMVINGKRSSGPTFSRVKIWAIQNGYVTPEKG